MPLTRYGRALCSRNRRHMASLETVRPSYHTPSPYGRSSQGTGPASFEEYDPIRSIGYPASPAYDPPTDPEASDFFVAPAPQLPPPFMMPDPLPPSPEYEDGLLQAEQLRKLFEAEREEMGSIELAEAQPLDACAPTSMEECLPVADELASPYDFDMEPAMGDVSAPDGQSPLRESMSIEMEERVTDPHGLTLEKIVEQTPLSLPDPYLATEQAFDQLLLQMDPFAMIGPLG